MADGESLSRACDILSALYHTWYCVGDVLCDLFVHYAAFSFTCQMIVVVCLAALKGALCFASKTFAPHLSLRLSASSGFG
jgi:hypothetical protein